MAVGFLCLMLMPGCSSQSTSPATIAPGPQHRPQVFTTSLFLSEAATVLVDDSADVKWPFQNTSSTSWKPTVDQIKSLQSADLILLNGAKYEPWQSRLSLPRSRMLDTSDAFSDRLMLIESARSHQHGPSGPTDGTALAWATWLDPALAIEQVKTTAKALSKLLPGQSAKIKLRQETLVSSLSELDATVAQIASKTERFVTVSNNPQLSYLTRRLGWKLHLLPDSIPPEAQQETLTRYRPNIILNVPSQDPQDGEQSANELALSGTAVVNIDLCLTRLDNPQSVTDRMKANIKRIGQAVIEFKTSN